MSTQPETVRFYQFFQRFPDEEAAKDCFETKRWASEVSCPHCGSLSVASVKTPSRCRRCRACRQHFSVRTFSFLHNTAQASTMRFIEMTMDRTLGKRLTYKGLIRG